MKHFLVDCKTEHKKFNYIYHFGTIKETDTIYRGLEFYSGRKQKNKFKRHAGHSHEASLGNKRIYFKDVIWSEVPTKVKAGYCFQRGIFISLIKMIGCQCGT